jgi:hypothetical protein
MSAPGPNVPVPGVSAGGSAIVKGFGCRPRASDRPGIGPASESLRRRNPRESGERLTVYGDLAGQRRCREMVFLRLLRAESR